MPLPMSKKPCWFWGRPAERLQQGAAVLRREEAEGREDHGDHRHRDDLHARAEDDRELVRGRRRSEHVAVDLS